MVKQLKKISLSQTVNTLANVGVIAGIVFLAIEIQQNTRSLEASSYQVLTDRIIEINNSTIERSDIRANEMTRVDYEGLPDDEMTQIRAEVTNRLRYGDLAYYQYELGMLSEERLESAIAPLAGPICSWPYQERWRQIRTNFVAEYRSYIDSRIAQC